ncbi:MAG: family N-acetyltransferase [Microbacterium sp.]|jgi:GNAT superfamily N-acetyltransferase|nr:family N-acetyltransferase [Microbacterium sp.]
MSASLRIRAATDADTADVCSFGERHVVAHDTPLLGVAAAKAQVERWWSVDEMRPAVRDGRVVLACRDNEVVGVAQFDPGMTPPTIWKLYVDPALRGQGVGPRLLDAVYALLPDTDRVGIEHFTVNVGAGRFYEREGFIVDRIEEPESGDPRQRVTWRVKTLR